VALSPSPTQNHLLLPQIATNTSQNHVDYFTAQALHNTYLESFEAECSSKVSVGILRVALDDD
jgi:hypothetical protein